MGVHEIRVPEPQGGVVHLVRQARGGVRDHGRIRGEEAARERLLRGLNIFRDGTR
ncbi:hypothetical protein SDC9_109599 [bioreactor metagenome]|uniref:Uncharacterized protein n=1 Tax=bioreactor metagenome TaxID=1076179 RepID=A0A645BBM8_9ZZZZ